MLSQSVIVILCIPVLAGSQVVLAVSLSLLASFIYITQQTNRTVEVLGPNGRPTGRFLPLSFCQWLTGLIEGDGTIILPIGFNALYPQIQIAFAMKDLPLARALQAALGTGSITLYPRTNSCRLNIADLAGLWLIVSILNGNMRTGKHDRLIDLLAVLNVRCGTAVMSMGLDFMPLIFSAWLSGMAEADSHFSVRLTLGVLYPRVAVAFELTQAVFTHTGVSNLPIMQAIASMLLSASVELVKPHTYPGYRIRANSVVSLLVLRAYFSVYPLYSSKHLDYLDWCKVNDMMIKGAAHLRADEVKAIKEGMNSKRTHFYWSHLEYLHSLRP